MKTPPFSRSPRPSVSPSAISRRRILRGLGVGLALPMLDSMIPACAAAEASVGPQRLIAIETNQGILPKYFFPTGEGRDYKASPYLQILEPFRDRMTVFSGVSHPQVDGGHSAGANLKETARRWALEYVYLDNMLGENLSLREPTSE